MTLPGALELQGAKIPQTIPPSMTLRALLDARRAEGRRFSLDEAIAVIVPVTLDLKERHDRGEKLYVHPSAIAPGADGLAKLNPRIAVVPTAKLDRYCLAPELQSTLEPGDARATVYSLGAVLYEMLTGEHIGPAMKRPRDVDPSLPESVEILIGKSIIGDRTHRPADLGALASAMYHLAPQKSIHPPEVEGLDQSAELDVDVKFSMMPPAAGRPIPEEAASVSAASIPRAAAVPRIDVGDPYGGVIDRGPDSRARRADDPHVKLANLKHQLENDPRPRYVVNKDKMDHGPFSAVELLQQIASNLFVSDDGLRDEISGQNAPIREWEEFAPFAEQAGLRRDNVREEKEVVLAVAKEKKSGIAKIVIGIAVVAAVLAVPAVWFVAKRGTRNERVAVDIDYGAGSVDLDGGIKGRKKPTGGGGAYHGGGTPGAGGAGGQGGVADNGSGSFESALDNNVQEMNMGGADTPDLTRAQLAAPMRSAGCGIPKGIKVTVQVAVQMGHAVGVSVSTDPPNAGINASCAGWARGLSWPVNPKRDFVTTVYGPYND